MGGTFSMPSVRLELIKSNLRRYVAAGVVESVMTRAVFATHVDLRGMSQPELEMVVARAVIDLRRILEPKLMSSLLMELTEILAEASDEFDLQPASVPGYSGVIRVARQY